VRRSGLIVAGLLAWVVGGCGPAPSSSRSPSVAPASASAASPSSAYAAPSPSAGVTIDETLLEALPAELDGVPLLFSAEGIEAARTDPAVARDVVAIAAGLLADPAGDFAFATVARLRPNVMSEEFFRDWRDSYDAAACEPAGSVAGHAESELGGRPVFIATCGEGLRTYHTFDEQRNLVVSISSLGDRRFGERLLEGMDG
jgi:hypothetical protein